MYIKYLVLEIAIKDDIDAKNSLDQNKPFFSIKSTCSPCVSYLGMINIKPLNPSYVEGKFVFLELVSKVIFVHTSKRKIWPIYISKK